MKYLTLFCVIGFFCSSALAQTNFWIGSAGDHNWNTAANWSNGHVPLTTEDVEIHIYDLYNTNIYAPTAFAVHSLDITVGYLTLEADRGTYTFADGLTVESGSSLDIGNSILLVSFVPPLNPVAYYQNLVLPSDADGAWETWGTGITSLRMVSANDYRPHYYGLAVVNGNDGIVSGLAANTIEITTAVVGDCNLDGTVDFTDYSILAGNYGTAGAGWDQGDFDYDGTVDFGDYSLMAGNYDVSYGPYMY